MRYLGVPITISRLTKIECRGLVDKILAKVHIWATRNLSFVEIAKLISSITFGMFNYWASIFLLPNEVLKSITKISRDYLWGVQKTLGRSLTNHGSTHAYQRHREG